MDEDEEGLERIEGLLLLGTEVPRFMPELGELLLGTLILPPERFGEVVLGVLILLLFLIFELLLLVGNVVVEFGLTFAGAVGLTCRTGATLPLLFCPLLIPLLRTAPVF